MSAKEDLKKSFFITLDFDEKVKIVDVLGEMGKDAYNTLNEIRKCARGCWLRYRINEKLHKLV
ncbi:MAG: hypothetical protein H3Z53_07930 [archaeon]|nr:hypothetical protein [archaeon]MCP8314282.1 hypothetical protein [archaeon]